MAMLSDASATSPDYNAKDIFEGVFNAGKWDLKPGSPPGSGNLWCLPLGFELYCLAYNKKYFDEKGIKVPTTLDELSELAAKLKDWNGPGSYGVAVRGTRNWATIHPGYMSSFKSCRRQRLRHRERKADVRARFARVGRDYQEVR